LGIGVLILLFPILTVFALKVYQNHLIRQTERSLIAQSVLIGEMWRDRWLEEIGISSDAAPGIRPRHARDQPYVPIESTTDLSHGVDPPVSAPIRLIAHRRGAKWNAGQRITPAVERAKIFNLSSARVLDENGCAVAASGKWLGACFDYLPEVRSALKGRYDATLRQRISDEPKPSLASIKRRGGRARIYRHTCAFRGNGSRRGVDVEDQHGSTEGGLVVP
jgi:hypothetical protein